MDAKSFILKRYDDFIERAAHAEARAKSAADPDLQDCWRECAASWRFMAQRTAELNRETDSRRTLTPPPGVSASTH